VVATQYTLYRDSDEPVEKATGKKIKGLKGFGT
jgi:hypothetical protein